MAAPRSRSIRLIGSMQGLVPEVCAGTMVLAGAAGMAAGVAAGDGGAGAAHGLVAAVAGAGLGALLLQRRRRTRALVRSLERQVAERTGALEAVVLGAATEVGDDFFRKLVEHLARALDARFVCTGEIEGDQPDQPDQPARVRAFAVWNDRQSEPIEYDLAGTPCRDVIDRGAALCVNDDLIARYPDDPWLAPLSAAAYCGAPVRSRDGAIIGLVAVIAARPFESPELARSLVSIFAERAGAELDRTRADEELRIRELRLRMAMEAAGEGLWDWDLTTGKTFYSDSWYTMLGFEPGELDMNITSWEKLIHPDDVAGAWARLDRHFRGETPRYVSEQRLRTKSGQWRWILDVGEVVERDADGKPVRALGVHIDIDEQKRVQAELARAREAAEAASEAKTEFLANMSHEIRTPMTAILGYADLLAAPEQTPDQRAEHAAIIRRNGEHLLNILSDILDVSRIEAGMLRMETVEFSPVRLIEDVCRLLDAPAAAKGLRLERRWQTPLPATIGADPGRLRQILNNLIGNAVKFTERGGLTVTTLLEEGALRICVEDTGIGIEPERIEALFEPFSQADPSVTRRFGGAGLGLTISRNLARMLGGEITARSEPGAGSAFTLTLPAPGDATLRTEAEIQRAIAAPERGSPRDGGGTHASPRDGGGTRASPRDGGGTRASPRDGGGTRASPRDGGGTRASPRDGGTRALLRARILLAEDGVDNQRLIRHHLEAAGAHVEVAENGRVAVEAALGASAAGEPFDLILMDMQMPVMDGYTAAAELRRRGNTAPVVALTAHAVPGDRERCVQAGCDDYLAKPVDREALLTMCRRWLRSRRAAA